MYKIAICDDEINFCTKIENLIIEYCSIIKVKVETDIFFSGEALYKHLKQGENFDLIFLDIEMSNLNGIEVGKIIRTELCNQTTQIVYVSCREEYYRELFEVQPMGFISKPVTTEEIERKIKTFLTRFAKINELFKYQKGHDIFKIPIKNIIWFESKNKEITIVSTTGKDTFYGKLQNVYEDLAKYRFLQIHKSFLVNSNHIRKYEYDKVYMSNSVVLPISQSQRKQIREHAIKTIKEDIK